MANISTYPIGTPAQGDLIPGTQKYTDANGKTENLTRNFTVAQLAAFANSYSLGYTVYTAALTAGAGAAPTATILQNTTGLTFTWTRTDTGQFTATVAGTPFVEGKFWAISSAKVPQITSIVRTSTSTCRLDVIESQNGNALNSLVEAYVEIRIYK